MPRNKRELVTGDQANDERIPPAESGASVVPCERIRHEDATQTHSDAAKTEIDVFEIRPETFIESVQPVEGGSAKQTRGARRDRDCRRSEWIPVSRHPMTNPPCATGSTHQIVRAVDRFPPGSIENQARGEAFLTIRRGGETLGPLRIQFHIAVQDRDPRRPRGAPTGVDSARKTCVLIHRDDIASGAAGDVNRVIRRGVVDDDDLLEGDGLFSNGLKKPFQHFGAIVHGYDRGDGFPELHCRLRL